MKSSKKTFITFFTMFMAVFALAQPTIETTYLPVVNSKFRQVYASSAASITLPSKGANQVWDYANQFPNTTDTFDFSSVDPDQTPYSSFFPSATHAAFSRVPLGINDSSYQYFRIDTNGLESLGFYSILDVYDTVFIASPSERLSPFDWNYGDVVRDTSLVQGDVDDYPYLGGSYNVRIKTYKYKEAVADAYGSLVTPIGTFDDVLIVSEKIHTIDSFFVNLGSGFIPATNSENHYKRIRFIRNNTFGSSFLMELATDTAETQVSFAWYILPTDVGSISGTVYDTTGLAISNGDMILYRENSNFTKNDILATTTVDASGNYTFTDIPYGEYRVACRPDLSIYIDAMTTYVGDTTDWINCQSIFTTGPTSINNDITLVYHPTQLGLGSISGSLQQDYTFSKAGGDPIPGIDIIIEKTPAGNVSNSGASNGSGLFTIDNLNDGDYTLFVDIPGLNMAGSYNFTISGGTAVSSLDFKIGFDSIHPINIPTVVESYSVSNSQVRSYPNPFYSVSTIEIQLKEQSNVQITLLNLLGEVVENVAKDDLRKGSHKYQIGEGLKSSGIYFVKISINNENQTLKLVRK